jgi:hypothetical protein
MWELVMVQLVGLLTITVMGSVALVSRNSVVGLFCCDTVKERAALMKMESQMNEGSKSSEFSTVRIKWEVWKELRELAGRQIDPTTAEVLCSSGKIGDPYGVYPNERDCIGRLYFARSPGTNLWIEFGDLPEATRVALKESVISRLRDDETPF